MKRMLIECGKLPSKCLPWPMRLFILLFFLFSMKSCYCDKSCHCFMQMSPFLSKGQHRECAEPGCCKLADGLQNVAKHL